MSDAGDLLREIIAGRSVPPTNAEVRVHAERGARWLVAKGGGRFEVHVEVAVLYWPVTRDWHIERGAVRWWPLAADGCPCAWPSGGE